MTTPHASMPMVVLYHWPADATWAGHGRMLALLLAARGASLAIEHPAARDVPDDAMLDMQFEIHRLGGISLVHPPPEPLESPRGAGRAAPRNHWAWDAFGHVDLLLAWHGAQDDPATGNRLLEALPSRPTERIRRLVLATVARPDAEHASAGRTPAIRAEAPLGWCRRDVLILPDPWLLPEPARPDAAAGAILDNLLERG